MFRPDRIVRRLLRVEFLVEMKTGQTWRGVLVEADEHTLSLLSASHITRDGAVPVDGQLFLPRADVAFIQRT